jgi:hypothetical protein
VVLNLPAQLDLLENFPLCTSVLFIKNSSRRCRLELYLGLRINFLNIKLSFDWIPHHCHSLSNPVRINHLIKSDTDFIPIVIFSHFQRSIIILNLVFFLNNVIKVIRCLSKYNFLHQFPIQSIKHGFQDHFNGSLYRACISEGSPNHSKPLTPNSED